MRGIINKNGQVGWIILAIFALISVPFISLSCNAIGSIFGWGNKAIQVVSEEVDPKILLQKYMWFKDASAQLDQKVASIKIFKKRTENILSNSDKTRSDKEAYYLALTELDGIKASYNELVAEYNSQMSKVNWRFCNIGSLPQGATEPLPREYKPYQEE